MTNPDPLTNGPQAGGAAHAVPHMIREEGEDAFHALRATLGFDLVFAEEFKILRPYLGRISRGWPIKIQEMIFENEELAGKISSRDALHLDDLMKRYQRQMLGGRFYEEFFNATEDLASFFRQRNVPVAWLIGAFMNVFYDAQLDIFFQKEARQGRVVVAALRCLLKIMTLTIQIINRTSLNRPIRIAQPAAVRASF